MTRPGLQQSRVRDFGSPHACVPDASLVPNRGLSGQQETAAHPQRVDDTLNLAGRTRESHPQEAT